MEVVTMALIRREREPEALWPQPFGRELADWWSRPVETWRRMFDEGMVNVEEFVEGNQLVVRAELPGVDPDKDVDISIVDGTLRIRAERRQEEKVEDRNYRRAEIRYGSFTRMLPLPAQAKEEDIQASYKDGILEVRAPIEEGRAPSRIPIQKA
jgi:HSP20 family protein